MSEVKYGSEQAVAMMRARPKPTRDPARDGHAMDTIRAILRAGEHVQVMDCHVLSAIRSVVKLAG